MDIAACQEDAGGAMLKAILFDQMKSGNAILLLLQKPGKPMDIQYHRKPRLQFQKERFQMEVYAIIPLQLDGHQFFGLVLRIF